MRHRFTIQTTGGETREVIVDAPDRETAEDGLWTHYPGAVVTGYGRWNPEPEEEPENGAEDGAGDAEGEEGGED